MSDHSNPLAQFEIKPLIQLPAIGGYDISFTNSSLWMVVTCVAILLFFALGLRKAAMVPGRSQSLLEMLHEFVSGIVHDNVGQTGFKYFPLIFSLFLFILFANLLGMLPYSFTVTSHIVVTFALAIVAFTGMILIGLFKHGPHFFSMFVPSGVPKLMLPLIAPIEMISFLVRPFSLSIRLAVAMTAGHILLKVIASFIGMLLHAGGWYSLITVFPFAMVVLLVGLEIFIAILQAYVFALLTTMYLNDTLNLHH